MVVKKSTKDSGLVIYSQLKNGAFTAVKRNAAFYTKDVKGVPFVNKRYTRGIPSCSEMVCKREGVGPLGRASLLPPPPLPLV